MDALGFGNTAGDTANLELIELDQNNITVVPQWTLSFTTAKSGFEPLSRTWTTNSGTSIVRFRLRGKIGSDYSHGHIKWDCCVLDGPKPTVSISGTVTSGGAPVQGAVISNSETYQITWTDADGHYALRSFDRDPGLATVSVQKKGFIDEHKNRNLSSGANIIDFDLKPPPDSNLLDDGALDQAWAGLSLAMGDMSDVYMWGKWRSAAAGGNANAFAETYHPVRGRYIHSGKDAIGQSVAAAAEVYTYQYPYIHVQPSTQYKAAAYIMAVDRDGLGFGHNPADSAEVLVEELDSGDNVIATNSTIPLTSATQDFVYRSVSFTTGPSTVKVIFMLHSNQNSASSHGWVVYDDCSLEGPAATATISGTITSGGSPVVGAYVEDDVTENSAYTGADGSYTLATVAGPNWIRASAAGCITQTKYRDLNAGAANVDFDLSAIAGNILSNPGFDEANLSGWYIVAPAGVDMSTESFVKRYLDPASYDSLFFQSGEQAGVLEANNGGLGGGLCQLVPVLPNSEYTLGGWFHPSDVSQFYPTVDSGWGTAGDSQKARLQITEYHASGSVVLDHTGLPEFSETSGWVSDSCTFTTQPNTALLAVGGYAYMVKGYYQTLAHAVFDTFSLVGTRTEEKSIGKAKQSGGAVILLDKIVTAVLPTYFYIEEADRSCGIKVIGSDARIKTGTHVAVGGVISVVDGEACVQPNLAVVNGSFEPRPDPLGMMNRAILTSGLGDQLYVTIWGRVSAVSSDSFTLTDGSGGVLKVYGAAIADDFVSVRGVIGTEPSGTGVVPGPESSRREQDRLGSRGADSVRPPMWESARQGVTPAHAYCSSGKAVLVDLHLCRSGRHSSLHRRWVTRAERGVRHCAAEEGLHL